MSEPDSTPILSWFHQLYNMPAPALGAVTLVLSITLFSSTGFLASLGLEAIVDFSRPGLGFLFLTAMFLSAARLLGWTVSKATTWKRQRDQLARWQGRLGSLTADEKKVLRKFIGAGKRVAYFPISDGVVQLLVGEHVLGQTGSTGMIDAFPFHIQPWAWDHLNANPHLLEPGDAEQAELEAERQRKARFGAMF